MNMYGLEIQNLAVDFGKFKMNATVNIRRGCITGLIGRNGAGKSTLIKTIMRQQDALSGKILYDGKPFKGNEVEILNKIACVFDIPHFNTQLKPKSLFKLCKSIYPQFDAELYERLMKKFNLPSDVRVNKFSFGMQRKYCLILALCQKPDILLLDEPTSGVDPYDRNNVVELIQEFMMDESHTVLFSTHITEDLDRIADYIVIMQDGVITLDEEKESICENYRLIQCAELTDELKKEAVGIQKSMFGYTVLTKNKQISGEGLQVKVPTVEELFVHTLGNEVSDSANGRYMNGSFGANFGADSDDPFNL